MKQILMALAVVGFTYCSATAQEALRVCRKSTNNKVSCYNTKYAQNFPVCKDNAGYHICGETRTNKNSTATAPVAVVNDFDNAPSYEVAQGFEGYKMQETTQLQNMSPKSQSYPDYQENATVPYRSYNDDEKGRVRVCYGGDNVAELNRNPYRGCPAPQYDGPERTQERAWSHGD